VGIFVESHFLLHGSDRKKKKQKDGQTGNRKLRVRRVNGEYTVTSFFFDENMDLF
jgi:hypothetical protein